MVAGGVCPFQAVIDFSRDGGMEAFASIRMNDVHDSFIPNGLTIWKMRHPELLVDTNGTLPEFELYTSSQDFSHEPVRRRKLEIIEEICEGYDVDGFELDYIRHPVLFSRRMRREPCTQDEIEIMTSFMRQVRETTDATAARRGRPVLIATRVPDSFALSLDNGLDLQAWLKQDLVDILIAGGGYAPCSLPVEEFIEASRPHGVQVYPCINQRTASRCLRWLIPGGRTGSGIDLVPGWCGWCVLLEPGHAIRVQDRRRFSRDAESRLRVPGRRRRAGGACRQDEAVLRGQWPFGSPVLLRARVESLATADGIEEGGAMTLRRGVIGRVPLVVGDETEATRPTRATLTVEFDDAAWREVLLFRLNGEELRDGKFAAASDGQQGGSLSYAVRVPR